MKKKSHKKRKQPLLSHHSKTGKLIHHRHTSYPLLGLILLFVGVFMTAFTYRASAADVQVNGTVLGSPPTTPATIVSPVSGTHFTQKPITVNGTCGPTDFIKLYRNALFSGATICAADGTFQIQTDLSQGGNVLQARTFNGADVEGPTSPTVTVTYTAPVVPGGGSSGGSSGGGTSSTPPGAKTTTPSAPPFVINTDNLYKGYFTGDSVEWQLDLAGGKSPYALSIAWGDGAISATSVTEPGPFRVKHTYKRAGAYQGSYTIRINAADANGNTTFIQLLIIVHDKMNSSYVTPGTTGTPGIDINGSGSFLSGLPYGLGVLLPAYSVVALMFASFWLGQSHRLSKIKVLARIKHR